MKEPLIPNVINQRKNIFKEWSKLDSILIDRFSYLFKRIGKICGFTFNGWHVLGATAGFYGEVDLLIRNNIIDMSKVILEDISGPYYSPNALKIIINGREIDMYRSVPTRWLFENFEKELKNARKLYLQKMTRKNAAKDHIRNIAKAKLSEKEIRILGL